MSEQDKALPYDDRSYMAGYNKGFAAGRKLENEECAPLINELLRYAEHGEFRCKHSGICACGLDELRVKVRQRQAKG